ncbi:ABC transporter permease [Paraliomyxa miuraensis]|uniref:ABC transporter permease n=1 Tax=Paraliomyxa miuraensis TaxID=376150 RepID=UPI0022529D23|nr:ABC-2 family transporter protein [Paraliomyxa miuraensis]MCX4241669.1 ABC-2 family transporter protein [Paraliomyxa miuraensis]
MRAYVAIFEARFRALLQYRAAALAGLATQVFWGLVRVMIFTAFYASSTGAQPMTLPEVITYVWLTQALLMMLPWRPDPDVEQLIRSGNVAYELVRPVDLHGLWLARAVAQRTAPVLLRCLPMVVLAYSVFGMAGPAGPLPALAFAVSLCATVALSAALTALLSVSTFFTLTGRGLHSLVIGVLNLMSGAIIPLPLLPEWIQPLVRVLPFRGLLDTPFRLYMGHLPPEAALQAVGHQLLWTVLLVLAGRWLLARALRRVVVQGG